MTSSTNKFKLNKVKFGTVLHFVRIISMLSVDICKRYRVCQQYVPPKFKYQSDLKM